MINCEQKPNELRTRAEEKKCVADVHTEQRTDGAQWIDNSSWKVSETQVKMAGSLEKKERNAEGRENW